MVAAGGGVAGLVRHAGHAPSLCRPRSLVMQATLPGSRETRAQMYLYFFLLTKLYLSSKQTVSEEWFTSARRQGGNARWQQNTDSSNLFIFFILLYIFWFCLSGHALTDCVNN